MLMPTANTVRGIMGTVIDYGAMSLPLMGDCSYYSKKGRYLTHFCKA